jgi:hypothetical protein
LLYPGLVPVENVAWMLLSGGAKLAPRSGLGGEVVYSGNNFTMLNIWEFYCILVSELQQGENSGGP